MGGTGLKLDWAEEEVESQQRPCPIPPGSSETGTALQSCVGGDRPVYLCADQPLVRVALGEDISSWAPVPGGGCPSFLRGIWAVVTRSVQCLQILYNGYQIGIQRLTCLGF